MMARLSLGMSLADKSEKVMVLLKMATAPLTERQNTWSVLLVDSGAFAHVCPPEFEPQNPITPPKRKLSIQTASGQSVMHLGSKLVFFKRPGGGLIQVRFEVCNKLRRPILSVGALRVKGIYAYFDQRPRLEVFDGMSSNRLTEVPLREEKRLFYLDLEAQESSRELEALEDEDEGDEDEERQADEEQEEGSVQEQPAAEPTIPRVPRPVVGPSKQEWTAHQAVHLPFQTWCRWCVMSRSKERPHRTVSQQHLGPVPLIEIDYSFIKMTPSERVRTVLLASYVQTGYGFAMVVKGKGGEDPQSARMLLRFLEECGLHHKVILRSAKEVGATSLVRDLAALRGPNMTLCETVPRGSKGSIGSVDRYAQEVLAMTRTLLIVLRSMWGIEVQVDMGIVPWIVRHASWLINRYQGHRRNNGATSFQVLHDRKYLGTVFRFGQPVLAHVADIAQQPKLQDRWCAGVWLGKSYETDANLVMTQTGVKLARTCKEALEFDEESRRLLLRSTEEPTAKGEPALRTGVEAGAATTPGDHTQKTNRRLQFWDQLGPTPGCTTCQHRLQHRHHSNFCKRRWEQWLRKKFDEETKTQQITHRIWGKKPRSAMASPGGLPSSSSKEFPGAVPTSWTTEAHGVKREAEKEPDDLRADVTMDAGKSGDKREAEQDAEDLRAEVTPPSREDLLGQVEAVRSELLCNVVKKGPPWYATTTGELLDEADVEKGMDRERKDFQQFQVYEEVTTTDFARDQAAGKKPELVEAGWVLVKKPSGAVRCRCVCTQVNYGSPMDTFAATPTVVALRLLLALALQRNLEVHLGDVHVAFLHADLEPDDLVYVKPPATETSSSGIPKTDLLWRLKKALYGLRKAPKYFQRHLAVKLGQAEWKRLRTEPQLWYHQKTGSLLLAHADDLLLAAPHDQVQTLKKRIQQDFDIKWGAQLGEHWEAYLGFEWRRGKDADGRPFVEERLRPEYVDKALQEYGLEKCRSVSTPGPTAADQNGSEKPLNAEAHRKFRRAVGMLMFILSARPDMAYAVKEAARNMSQPTEKHEVSLKRCLRYLKGSREDTFRLTWREDDADDLQVLRVTADANWGAKPDRRSTSGIIVWWKGIPLMFSSRTQATISLSTAEAELAALTSGVADAMLVKSMLSELGVEVKLKACSDSSSALAIASRLGPGRVRHLQIKQLWIQDEVQSGRLTLQHLPGIANPADLLTKALPKERHIKLSRMLGMRSPVTSFSAELPSESAADEPLAISMLSGSFEIVEPRCLTCHSRLQCVQCKQQQQRRSQAVQSRAVQRVAAVRGSQTSGYGRSDPDPDAVTATTAFSPQLAWNQVQNLLRSLMTRGMTAEEIVTLVLQTSLEQAEAMLQQLR